MKIPKFELRFNKALKDPILTLAQELYHEGFGEDDVVENMKDFPCLPDPQKISLRNHIRDLERK